MVSVTRGLPVTLVSVLILTHVSDPALSQTQDHDECVASATAPDSRVEACTRVLGWESRQLTRRRAIALVNRASARKVKGEIEAALSDLTEAIGVDPNYAAAYADRGHIY